jgi:hypothetical protein
MAIGKCSEPKRLLGDWIEMALGGNSEAKKLLAMGDWIR